MPNLNPIVALGAIAMLASLAAPASAQRGYQIDRGAYVFSKESTSRQPRHGYSGFYKGPQQLFCDYERTPVRSCDSRRRCKVTRWILKEYCY